MRSFLVTVGLTGALGLAGAAPVAPQPRTPPDQQTPPAAELARRIQARYNTITDFTADFAQTYKYELMRQTSVERGDLKVKKPNRMRWTYTTPTRKEFVADGTTFYQHYPRDKFVQVTPLPKAGDAPLALLFLAGRGDLTRDFTPSMPATQPANEWQLLLTPNKRQDDYSTLTIIVRRDTLDLSGLILVDDAGTQTFLFTKFQANRGLKDGDFVFVIPKGTEIGK
jgi:outer membrane lipoprotein carrier protein